MKIEIKRMSENAKLPDYQSSGAAAIDLHADILLDRIIKPECHMLIGTGIAVHINNPSYVGKVYTRSGNGIRHGLILRNGTGIIDSDYQGEIFVCLLNTGFEDVVIHSGDRIAQMVFTVVQRMTFIDVSDTGFSKSTERGNNGIGSTGK